MNLRARAVAIANQFEGRCTCSTMDGGVDCPWCQVFREMLRVYPLGPDPALPAGTRSATLAPS
jgi:hypothetical protein